VHFISLGTMHYHVCTLVGVADRLKNIGSQCQEGIMKHYSGGHQSPAKLHTFQLSRNLVANYSINCTKYCTLIQLLSIQQCILALHITLQGTCRNSSLVYQL